MTVKFGRIIINGNDETVLNTIKTWLESKIVKSELNEKIGDGIVTISNIDNPTYTLSCIFFLKPEFHVTKYKNLIITKFQTFDKSTLNWAEMIKYNECSHDSDNPQPCNPIVIMRWGK